MEEQNFKEIKVDGHTYQVFQITGRKALHLDRKVTDMAYMVRPGADSTQKIGMLVFHAFAEMEDSKFDDILALSLHNVVRMGNDGESNIRVTLENVYDFFKGAIEELYAFLLALWEVYELTPFSKAKAVKTGA